MFLSPRGGRGRARPPFAEIIWSGRAPLSHFLLVVPVWGWGGREPWASGRVFRPLSPFGCLWDSPPLLFAEKTGLRTAVGLPRVALPVSPRPKGKGRGAVGTCLLMGG